MILNGNTLAAICDNSSKTRYGCIKKETQIALGLS